MGTNSELRSGSAIIAGGLISNLIFSLPPYTAGVFMASLQADFQWTRFEISFGVTILTVGMAAGGVIAGRLGTLSRQRSLIAIGLLGYCVGFTSLALMGSSLWLYWVLLFCLSLAGALASPVTVSRIVASQFDSGRGTALGITMLGSALAAGAAPALLGLIIAEWGWRWAYIALSTTAALSAPIVWILLRVRAKGSLASGVSVAPKVLAERRRAFPTLAVAIILISLSVGGGVVHLVPILREVGLEATRLGAYAGLLGLSIFVARLGTGLLLDLFDGKLVAAAVMAVSGLATISFAFLGDNYVALVPIGIGLSLGAELDLGAYLLSRYSSQASYGKRFGLLFGLFQIGLAISPPVYALMRDGFGKYYVACATSGILLVISSGLFLTLPRTSGRSF